MIRQNYNDNNGGSLYSLRNMHIMLMQYSFDVCRIIIFHTTTVVFIAIKINHYSTVRCLW